MASSFKIRFSINAMPIESIEMVDTSQVLTGVHSSIDKSFGGGGIVVCSAVPTDVVSEEYLTTTGGVLLGSIMSVPQGIKVLFIKINSPGSSGIPDVRISVDGGVNYFFALSGTSDCLLFRSDTGLTGQDVLIKSSGATALANISILVGGS